MDLYDIREKIMNGTLFLCFDTFYSLVLAAKMLSITLLSLYKAINLKRVITKYLQSKPHNTTIMYLCDWLYVQIVEQFKYLLSLKEKH